MTIAQTATTSFKVELPQGVHNFGPTSPDTFKVALYTAAASLDATTTVYTTSGEVVGSGYTAGGNTLTISVTPVAANNSSGTPTSYWSFNNTSWAGASFTARGALIYNSTEGNKSVAVLDFGSDKTVNNDTFQIIFPTPDANSAIVRIS
jgi:glucose dehydrogenase